MDRARKLPVTSLLRALGYGSDQEIIDLLGDDDKLRATMTKDGGDDGTRRKTLGTETKDVESGLMDIYHRLRPGEVGTRESAEKLLQATFFDNRRYDMMRVGRYKYNKKLAIASRIRGHVVDTDIVDPTTGEVLIAAGERIPASKTDPLAKKIQDCGVNDIVLRLEDRTVRVIGNNFVDAAAWLGEETVEKAGINEMVHLPTLMELLETAEREGIEGEDKVELLRANLARLMPKHILIDDIVDSAGTLCNAAAALKTSGAEDVVAYCTHGVLSGGAVARVDGSALAELVITDSIGNHAVIAESSKIRHLTIAPLLAEAIKRIADESSVSSLFD